MISNLYLCFMENTDKYISMYLRKGPMLLQQIARNVCIYYIVSLLSSKLILQ